MGRVLVRGVGYRDGDNVSGRGWGEVSGRLLEQLDDEVRRQDAKHGPTFNAASALGRIRLGVACIEDEAKETLDAWRDDRKTWDFPHVREEALQVAAVALRLVRQIDRERRERREGGVPGGLGADTKEDA